MDKYDKQIEYLTENPDLISTHWMSGVGLFAFAGSKSTFDIGCLTQIRNSYNYVAETPELTERIRSDERIPKYSCDITVEHLPVFAEWQRVLDKELPSRQVQDEPEG